MIFAEDQFAEGVFASPRGVDFCHPGIDLVGRSVMVLAMVGSYIVELPLMTFVRLGPAGSIGAAIPALSLVGSYLPEIEMTGDSLYVDEN
jgi:hypothetical protein